MFARNPKSSRSRVFAASSHEVRITSGKYRGRTLVAPGGGTHPMGSREKLALFNMLAPYLAGARVLDAFAGTGALGLEALSRGVSEVTFIENHPATLAVIRHNLAILDTEDRPRITIFPGKASNFASDAFYDIILADPPYDHFDPAEVEFLTSFLAPGGILALSHPSGAELDFATLYPLKTRKYANANLTIFERQESQI